MGDYFNKSQLVRISIERTPELIEITRTCFNGKMEPFASGGTVNLYHLGTLPSGLHVALRAFRTSVPEGKYDLEDQMRLMEHYCQNAEHLYSTGKSVPIFCVGVVSGEQASIFTEDLSKGGTQEVRHHPDNNYALVGAEKRKVFVDIDGLFRKIPGLELKYFLNENKVNV